MKNTRSINWIFSMVFGLTLASLSMQAQNNQSDLSAFLKAEQQDASKLIAAYTTPAIKGVSYGMTNGWYHTGKTHNKLGVDFGVTVSAVMMPTSDNHFNSSAIGLSPATHQTNTSTFQAPTIIGPDETTTYQSTYKTSAYPTPVTVLFNGPQGLDLKKNIGMSALPVPMVQLGIGLIMNTDLKVRFVPEQTVGASKVSMLGFGLLHDIKQHIPGLKLAPIDLSVLVGYNSVSGKTDLSNPPSSSTSAPPSSTDGKATYKFNSWVAQVIVSKKFSVLTLYAGLGYGAVDTKFSETGTYTYNTSAGPVSAQVPVTINFANNGAKLNLGMRLKFGPIYLNGDYTVQKYNSITVGFGVTIR